MSLNLNFPKWFKSVKINTVNTRPLVIVSNILTALGGWVAGGYIASKITTNEQSQQVGKFTGMVAAEMLVRSVSRNDEKDKKNPITHCERLNAQKEERGKNKCNL